jgi:hypothetical protein
MNNESVRYQIIGIEILDVEIIYPEKPENVLINFQFETNIEIKLNFDNKLVFIVPQITILNQKTQKKLGKIRVSCVYHIENFDDFADIKNHTIHFPENFERILNSISISTVRGVMYGQFRGTFLQNAILPVIDPQSLVKNKMEAKLNESGMI